MIRLITEIRQSSISPGDHVHTPILYFQMMLRIFAFFYKVGTFKRFWQNRELFVSILNNITKNDRLLARRRLKIQSPIFIRSILGICVCIAIADLITGAYFVGPTWRLTPDWWCRQLVSLARYTFFTGPPPRLDEAPEIDSVSRVDIVMAVVTAVGLFQRYISGLFCDMCLLSHVITLWSVTHSFAQSISMSLSTDDSAVNTKSLLHWKLVYRQYKAIQNLAKIINKALGNLVTCFMAEAIIFYAINLDVTLATQDAFRKGYMAWFYFDTFSILFIAADICSQVCIRLNTKRIGMVIFL